MVYVSNSQLIVSCVCNVTFFSTAAVDNLDHNPTSSTATGSFHGTGISIVQYRSHKLEGQNRGIKVINPNISSATSVVSLPSKYRNVPPAALKDKSFTAPSVESSAIVHMLDTLAEAKDELEWLKEVVNAVQKQQIDPTNWFFWSAYHASLQQLVKPAALNALLPLLVDNAHSVAMIKHSRTTIVQAAIQHLNLGQNSILTVDQPLFALAKQI